MGNGGQDLPVEVVLSGVRRYRGCRLLNDEAVAETTHRLQVDWSARVGLDLLA